MKNTVKIFFIVGICFLSIPFVNAQNKVGHLDLQYVLQNLEEYKKAESNMKIYADQIKKELEAKEKEFGDKYQEYQQKGATWPESILKTKVAELESLQAQIEDFRQKASTDVRNYETRLLAPIYEKIEKAVKEVAESNAFSCVLRTELCYLPLETNNVSNMVLRKLGVNK